MAIIKRPPHDDGPVNAYEKAFTRLSVCEVTQQLFYHSQL